MTETISELILETHLLIEEARLIRVVGRLRRAKKSEDLHSVFIQDEKHPEVAHNLHLEPESYRA